MSGKMNKLIKRYEEMFGESFPLMLCRGMSDADIAAIIEDCINKSMPYTDEDGLFDY